MISTRAASSIKLTNQGFDQLGSDTMLK
jgi:hypothetical protein